MGRTKTIYTSTVSVPVYVAWRCFKCDELNFAHGFIGFSEQEMTASSNAYEREATKALATNRLKSYWHKDALQIIAQPREHWLELIGGLHLENTNCTKCLSTPEWQLKDLPKRYVPVIGTQNSEILDLAVKTGVTILTPDEAVKRLQHTDVIEYLVTGNYNFCRNCGTRLPEGNEICPKCREVSPHNPIQIENEKLERLEKRIENLYLRLERNTDYVLKTRRQAGIRADAYYRLAYALLFIHHMATNRIIGENERSAFTGFEKRAFEEETKKDAKEIVDTLTNRFQSIDKKEDDKRIVRSFYAVENALKDSYPSEDMAYYMKSVTVSCKAFAEVSGVYDKNCESQDSNKQQQSCDNSSFSSSDYGLVISKPVFVSESTGSQLFLESLKTINGESLEWNRRGSAISNEVEGVIEIWDSVVLPSKEPYKTLYIYPHGNADSHETPLGFVRRIE